MMIATVKKSDRYIAYHEVWIDDRHVGLGDESECQRLADELNADEDKLALVYDLFAPVQTHSENQ